MAHASRWRLVGGCADKYEVSDTGLIRNFRNKRVLKPMLVGRRNNKRPKIRVSTMPRVDICVAAAVLEAFVGIRPVGAVVMHLDDNPLNNTLTNLRWGTPRENAMDMARKLRGGIQKLGPDAVRSIRERRTSGVRGVVLAKEYGVSQQRICDIMKGRTSL